MGSARQETVSDVLATRRATATEIEPFVGAWELMSPGAPSKLLRIEAQDGRAKGSFQLAGPTRERGLTLELAVLEVLADGRLAFGYINNMRPKGVLYYTLEKKQSGSLVGA